RIHVLPAVAAVEADREGRPGRQRLVPLGVAGERDGAALLGDRHGPAVVDLLVAGEVERHAPPGDRVAGVGYDDAGTEAAAVVPLLGVGDRTARGGRGDRGRYHDGAGAHRGTRRRDGDRSASSEAAPIKVRVSHLVISWDGCVPIPGTRRGEDPRTGTSELRGGGGVLPPARRQDPRPYWAVQPGNVGS